ncbi:ribulokinase [Sporosarcina sp. NPDC096371]|uniref:ribulokinase n=1 Tax=Sporosarcina sp. NPDC096371 TaxID=3364530 RepID=UPI0037FB4DBF
MSNVYVLGIDYGTESGRVLIVDVATGQMIAEQVTKYPHGVLTEKLPDGRTELGRETALQVPQDYLDVLTQSIPRLLQQTNIAREQVIGIGIDFTSCTILPTTNDFTPLCEIEGYQHRPHAFVKLWKHHAAEAQAQKLNDLAKDEQWIQRYGGTISAEWMIPKVMEIAEVDPEVFDETNLFLEAGDWVTAKLTGNLVRNSCSAGYKGMWHKADGYVDTAFLKKLHPKLERIYDTKLRGDVRSLGDKAGSLTKEMAEILGLQEGTAVAVGIIDAHAALPGTGVSEPGTLVMVMGTSTCHLLLSDKEEHVPGISGVVEDGILPGYFAYEAGQAAVGDLFAWFVDQQVPSYIKQQASDKGLSIHEYLTELAGELSPGESGLVALDWHNGSRTPWVDMSLSGVVVGQKLSTRPAELYRAYLEATAFGTRVIVELFEAHGIQIEQLVATGGIPKKNPLLMQIYADILQRDVTVNLNSQAPALGAAILGAVAAGKERGGYDCVASAIAGMSSNETITYTPNAKAEAVYDTLFASYQKLSRFFAKETSMMNELTALKI